MSNNLTKAAIISYGSVILFAGFVLGYLLFDIHNQKAKKDLKKDHKIVIIPMNEDNEGRPLFTVEVNGEVHEYMYAEEIGMSLLRGGWVTDEMIHFCDHQECE